MILTPEFLADLAHYNAGVRRARYAAYGPPPKPKRALVPCGTPGAYTRHKRAGEEPCEPCLQAASAAWKVSNDKRRRARQRKAAKP